MPVKSLGLATVLALSLIFFCQGILQAETDKNKDFHSMHMLMNHGLTMILDGSSLSMMAELDIDTTVARDPLTHGKRMIDQGKALIDRALRGPVMVEKHMQGMSSSKMMELTHQLGELMLKTVYDQDIMQPAREGSEINKNLHVLHLEANHALIMSAQGSNMVMMGQVDTSNELNRYSIEQGRKMMAEARTILLDLLNGSILKELGKLKLTQEDEEMFKFTKEMLINNVDVANLLIQMELE
jgi:hypothetical protein